jgi:hypothetical protein
MTLKRSPMVSNVTINAIAPKEISRVPFQIPLL